MPSGSLRCLRLSPKENAIGEATAKTAMIGAGKRTSVTFDAPKLSCATADTYYCSLPAHAAMMRGMLSIE
ncbi:plastocyanin/azurin family copper-binding protein [Pandoraea anapnoica]|uniref:plastocyanin/azurin family copper-binding protein n=1 Tax=Pandoraea anapnoica TaxID=2508301 RepID=UPI0012408BFF